MDYDLGYFDEESKKLAPLKYPFIPEIVSPMCPVRTRNIKGPVTYPRRTAEKIFRSREGCKWGPFTYPW